MSIQSELTRLQTAKQDITTAIETNLSQDIPEGTLLDNYAGYITAGLTKNNSIQTLSKITETDENTQEEVIVYRRGENAVDTSTAANAYQNVTTLVAAMLPEKVKTIGSNSFYGTTNLEYINLENITTVGSASFYRSGIKSINLNSATTIYGTSNNATTGSFRECKSLKEVKLGKNLTNIGYYSFYQCTALSKINLDNITHINFWGFGECSSLKEVNIPNLQWIAEAAFASCTGIEKITNLGTITYINGGTYNTYGSFNRCTNLKEINFPSTLRSIYAFGFYSCTKLPELDLTAFEGEQFEIRNDAFRLCTNLTTVKLPTDTVLTGGYQFCEQGGESYSAAKDAIIDFDINLHNTTMTTLSAVTFYRSYVKRVLDLGNITTIANASSSRGVFEGSTYLREVTLPTTITTIGTRAFYGCTRLQLKCLATIPPTISSNSYSGILNCLPIFVPDANIDDYKTATNWSAWSKKILPLSTSSTWGHEVDYGEMTNNVIKGDSGALSGNNWTGQVTDYIDIPSDCTHIYALHYVYRRGYRGAYFPIGLNMYDSNKTRISTKVIATNASTSAVNFEFDVDSGTKYIRTTIEPFFKEYAAVYGVCSGNITLLWPTIIS